MIISEFSEVGIPHFSLMPSMGLRIMSLHVFLYQLTGKQFWIGALATDKAPIDIMHLLYIGLSLVLVGIVRSGTIILRYYNNFPDVTLLSDSVQWKFAL